MIARIIILGLGLWALSQGAASAEVRACNTYVISHARYDALNFYGAEDKVVATLRGKTAPDSLKLQIEGCDDKDYYVFAPNGQPAIIRKTDVVLSTTFIVVPCDKTVNDQAIQQSAGNGVSGTPICRRKNEP